MNAPLHRARFDWQNGDWQALANLPATLPEKGAPDAETAELLLYRMQGLFQTGEIAAGSALAKALRKAGVPRKRLIQALLGGVLTSAAEGWLVLGRPGEALAAHRSAVGLNPVAGDPAKVADLRLRAGEKALRAGMSDLPRRSLFIDCGGYDGCSALKFLTAAPQFDCITFEPNPALWRYYEGLPTRMIGKAVHSHDGEVEFTVDPVDGDGSSIIKGKRIDAKGIVQNSACPVIRVPCVDLPALIARSARDYDEIVLKLDVEGAEYDILEKMLEDGSIRHLSRLYCEFHHDKISMPKARHDDILARLRAILPVEPWDASHAPFKVAPKDNPSDIELRSRLVLGIATARKKLTNVKW